MKAGSYLLAGVLFSISAAGHQYWQQYTNARFQYSICYPKDVLRAQPEAENSDGREFTGSHGVTMIAYGAEALQKSLKAQENDTVSDLTGNARSITYKQEHGVGSFSPA